MIPHKLALKYLNDIYIGYTWLVSKCFIWASVKARICTILDNFISKILTA